MLQPSFGDDVAWSWLDDYRDCLLGIFGRDWQSVARGAHQQGLTTWWQWREIRDPAPAPERAQEVGTSGRWMARLRAWRVSPL